MGVDHGYAVFEEIERFVEAGVSLEKALYSASTGTRRHFDFEHSTLKVGAPFEAVLLKESPFDDILALRHPERVWLGAA
jgi:hypothetical protein